MRYSIIIQHMVSAEVPEKMEENNIRRPKNLQGLLRFATEATKGEDAGFNVQSMDPERRQFLENALRAFTIDVIEQLQRAAEVIASDTCDKETQLCALDTILNYVDNIDTANDFLKIGGSFVLLRSIASPHSEVSSKSALIVAELAQNNIYCQEKLLEADILPKLMNLLNGRETAADGLRAISCLIRGYESGLDAFQKCGGLECLLRCLDQQSDQEKLITRATFLLNSLCNDFPRISNKLIELNAIEVIAPLIQPQTEYSSCLENLLALLCTLSDKAAVKQCLKSQHLNLKKNLETIVMSLRSKHECNEIIQYCQTILDDAFNLQQENENIR